MKLKNKDVNLIVNKSEMLLSKKLPVKIAFAVTYNYKRLKDFADTYQDTLNFLVREYSKKDDKGNIVIEPDGSIPFRDGEAMTEYKKALTDLDNMLIDVNVQTITIEDINSIDYEKYDILTGEDFLAIEYMVEK